MDMFSLWIEKAVSNGMKIFRLSSFLANTFTIATYSMYVYIYSLFFCFSFVVFFTTKKSRL